MATRVVMAQLSPTMEEGRLIEWKVAEGDEVSQGDILAEIETDKANMDVEALGGGVLRAILASPGETVPVGALIGVIAGPDEDISALLAEAGGGLGGASGAPSEDAAASADTAANADAVPAATTGANATAAVSTAAAEAAGVSAAVPTAPAATSMNGIKASPLARKMAREAGLSLADLSGTGPGGRIVKRDIEAAVAAGAALKAGGLTAPRPARLVEETLPLSQMRKAIARRLAESIGPVPHFFLTTEIDMEVVLDLRAQLNERASGPKVGVNDLLIKVAAEALARHPEINASWSDEGIRRHGSVDIGVAVAVEEGLITPVLRGVEGKGLQEISAEARALIERARSRRLAPEEYQGATFTISNLGMFEIDEFTAIINPPEAAILAVGRTAERAVVVDGEVQVRRRMRVTMSCDHRVIDGAMGARFLGTLKVMLENPLEVIA